MPSRRRKLVLAAVARATLAIAIIIDLLNAPAIQAQDATDWQTRAGGKMAFDVASVKPSEGAFMPSNFPLTPWDDYSATNGRLKADSTLAGYIGFAYKLLGNDVQGREFSRLPKWVNTDRYTIDARAATSTLLRIRCV